MSDRVEAADAEQSIRRIRVDDAAVERVARALFEHERIDGERWERHADAYLEEARAALAALTEEEA